MCPHNLPGFLIFFFWNNHSIALLKVGKLKTCNCLLGRLVFWFNGRERSVSRCQVLKSLLARLSDCCLIVSGKVCVWFNGGLKLWVACIKLGIFTYQGLVWTSLAGPHVWNCHLMVSVVAMSALYWNPHRYEIELTRTKLYIADWSFFWTRIPNVCTPVTIHFSGSPRT